MSDNRVIGRDNALPWHLPADMKLFKTLTMGHAVIMGRKTFDTVGKPLPGRRNVVLTRDRAWRRTGVEACYDLDEALSLVASDSEVFVAGGAEIFHQALKRADRIYLTVVHANVTGDAFFPSFSLSQWRLVEDQTHESDERHAYGFSFRRYERAR
jgi:dihydrofolate reductase